MLSTASLTVAPSSAFAASCSALSGTTAKATSRRVPIVPSNGERHSPRAYSRRRKPARCARRRASSAACAACACARSSPTRGCRPTAARGQSGPTPCRRPARGGSARSAPCRRRAAAPRRSATDGRERSRRCSNRLRDERPQFGLRERLLDRRSHDVLVQVEPPSADPCRLVRASAEPARERRYQRDALGHALAQPLELEARPAHRRRAEPPCTCVLRSCGTRSSRIARSSGPSGIGGSLTATFSPMR